MLGENPWLEIGTVQLHVPKAKKVSFFVVLAVKLLLIYPVVPNRSKVSK